MRCERSCVLLGVLSVLAFVGGCATPRNVLDLTIDPVPNPVGGRAVKIINITDLRKFDSNTVAGTPAVANKNELSDPAMLARAIGIKRDGLGKVMAEFVLPDGRTVEIMVREVAQSALRQKGYSVVADGSPAATSAIPVEINIRKFWVWYTPNVWKPYTSHLDFESEIEIKGAITLSGSSEIVAGSHSTKPGMLWDTVYRDTARWGLEKLLENCKTKIRNP